MKPKKTDEVRHPYDVDQLNNSLELQQHYTVTVQNKFDALGSLPDDHITTQCESLCTVIRELADEVIGSWKNIRQPWLSDDTYNIIQLKAAAKCQQNNDERCRLHGVFKARIKADRNNYLSCIADEVEEDLRHKK